MVPSLIAAALAVAGPPATADLGFMVGEWELRGAFNPGAPNERAEVGTQQCEFTLGDAYVRCERKLVASDGKTREQLTFHNYNELYARFEHLFITSNWPTKVIGSSTLDRNPEATTMVVEIAFVLPDGRTERVRSVDRFTAGHFESLEQLQVGDGEWRTNYQLNGTKVAR